jgi:putative ABC transport system permease protein
MPHAVQHLLEDVRFGVRQLRCSPLTTAVAIFTLAVGIGLNTAVFSLVSAVLLRPLPYPDPDRLLWISDYDPMFGQDTFASRGDYRIWKQQAQLFDRMAAYGTQDLALIVRDDASQERVASIGGDFWEITGARPALGRLFDEGDEPAVVLSYGLYQRRFGGQAAAIGSTVTLGGAPFVIAGVLPPRYRVTFPQQTAAGDELRDLDAFISLPRGDEPPGQIIVQTSRPAPVWIRVVGRLAPGVPISRARAEMGPLHSALRSKYPRGTLIRTLRVLPLQDKLAEQVRSSLLILLGAVVFVLMIATANVANLLLAQASMRLRETAIRTAMGAGRPRLAAQFLVEGLLLAVIAGVAGVLVAYLALPLMIGLAPFSITGIANVSVDVRVLLFSLLLTVATGIAFAWAPVIGISQVNPATVLGSGASAIVKSRSWLQGTLIAAEVALAVVLLAGAGLMVKSLWHLETYGSGFSPELTYVMRIPLSGPRYEEFDRKMAYIDDVLGRLKGTPGVEAAGISGAIYNLPVTVAGTEHAGPNMTPPVVAIRAVSPSYLRAMGVSLVRGRWPDADDALASMVVNETFARQLVPNGDAIGKPFKGSFVSGAIVGIVADAPSRGLDGPITAELYYPYQRTPPTTRPIVLAIRMADSVASTVAQLVASVDRTQPVYQFQRLEESLSDSVIPRRFNMRLLEVYAASAALMALAGTFGVVAYSVARRTRETAVRIALGAQPLAVVFMMARQTMSYVLGGVGVGVLGALGAGQTVRGMLYGVDPNDPAILAAVAAGLSAAALAASFAPALRAARVNPAMTLRQE